MLGGADAPVLSIGWDELGIISRCVLAFLKAGARLQHSDQVLVFMVSPPQGSIQPQAAWMGWGGRAGLSSDAVSTIGPWGREASRALLVSFVL